MRQEEFSVLSQYMRGRECVVPRTTHSLSYFVGGGMRQEENVWFLEPHVLRPALWEMVHERERTRGSKNRMFSLLFYGI